MRGMTDRNHLGMCSRIAVGKRPITGAGDDLVTAYQHAANRHLAALTGAARLIERHVHKRCHCHRRSTSCAIQPRLYTRAYSMIRKSGCRFSEKIMLEQKS